MNDHYSHRQHSPFASDDPTDLATMAQIVAILRQQGLQATLEFPGIIVVEKADGGAVYIFGVANDTWDADVYASLYALSECDSITSIQTPVSSYSNDVDAITSAILDALAQPITNNQQHEAQQQ